MMIVKFYSDFPELEGIQYHDGAEVAEAEKKIKKMRDEKEIEEKKKNKKITELTDKIKTLDNEMIELNRQWTSKYEEKSKLRKELKEIKGYDPYNVLDALFL